MLDIATLIKDSLTTNWDLEIPSSSTLFIALDEFDPKNPMFQVLLELNSDTKTRMVDGINLVEQRCKLTVYIRPKNFDVSTVSSTRTILINVQTEIDRILENFALTGVIDVELSGWSKISIDTGKGTKRGMMNCEETVSCQYYV